ncbi:hypothetical protein BX589_12023 [Paraburkholderia fungorum]|jgi:hypothetical protein|uniref:hypothetical protein n=1 Tax=Paraburkholderia fungorum TaxID=134537 RepID=UPI000D049945|nr:hypothetical protein [Paraburkholderia fungorum]PRZ51182.1 hypothetical protein BX589_12023 [Paraburkholderia fungorum]
MSNNITTVRQHLLDTLADLRNRETPMEIDRARAVADVARVLVDSAKVEVDFIKASGSNSSDFMQPEQPNSGATGNLPPGITGITRHVLKG